MENTNIGTCTLATSIHNAGRFGLYVDADDLDLDTLEIALETSRDFGCVEHQPREVNDDAAE